MFDYLQLQGMGFSAAMSVGNEANIDIVDCLEYLGACPHTKVITLYIEGITRGEAFVKTAQHIVRHKPVVALYVGGSEAGKHAGRSHTGFLPGPNEIYEGVFRQCGILRAQSLTEMFDYALALGKLPKPKGNRVIIQTYSGGRCLWSGGPPVAAALGSNRGKASADDSPDRQYGEPARPDLQPEFGRKLF